MMTMSISWAVAVVAFVTVAVPSMAQSTTNQLSTTTQADGTVATVVILSPQVSESTSSDVEAGNTTSASATVDVATGNATGMSNLSTSTGSTSPAETTTLSTTTPSTTTPAPAIVTTSGELIVNRNGNYVEALGVPFAERPNPFSPPQPINNADQQLNATAWGKMCLQSAEALAANGWTTNMTDQDCLNLNVWGFQNQSKRSPVMVYVHGGGGLEGSGAVYNGAGLSAGADVVVVSFNYRLGVLGWYAADYLEVTDDSDWRGAKGNWGLMDMELALQWVRSNIQNFGGDPTQVSVFGGGSGAWAICNMLSSPVFDSLFTTAILQSGSGCLGGEETIPEFAVRVAEVEAEIELQSYCPPDNRRVCLQIGVMGQDPTRFDRYLLGHGTNYSGGHRFEIALPRPMGIIDGVSISQSAYTRLRAGELNNRAIVVGTTANESNSFIDIYQSLSVPVSVSQAIDSASAFSSREAERLKTTYATGSNTRLQFSELMTDVVFGCGTEAFLRAGALTPGSMVRGYFFNIGLQAPPRAAALGASHEVDMLYLFGDDGVGAGGCFRHSLSQVGIEWQDAQAMAPTLNAVYVNEMQRLWGNIARGYYGVWPVYSLDSHGVMEIGQRLSKHQTSLITSINCNRCDALLATLEFTATDWATTESRSSLTFRGPFRQLLSFPSFLNSTSDAVGGVTYQANIVDNITSFNVSMMIPNYAMERVTDRFSAFLSSVSCTDGGGILNVNDISQREELPRPIVCTDVGVCTSQSNLPGTSLDLTQRFVSLVITDVEVANATQFMCADLEFDNTGFEDDLFLQSVPIASRTDCQLSPPCENTIVSGQPVTVATTTISASNATLVAASNVDCDEGYTGGDMAGLFFGTILIVLACEIAGYFAYKHQDSLKAKIKDLKCCAKLKSGPSMPKAMAFENASYDEDGNNESVVDDEELGIEVDQSVQIDYNDAGQASV